MTKALFLFFTLLLVIFPLFADVRSVRSRVLQSVGDSDIVKSRYANATSITSILNNPMAQITIKNDAIDATLLFDVDIQFGGDWDGEYIKTGIVKELGPNESITFSNTEVTTYLENVYDPEISDMFMSITNASDLLTLPDGEHSITLTAYEVIATRDSTGNITNLEKVNNGNGNPLTGTPVEVTFRVVTIGAIVVDEEPGVDSQNLIFTVPEIPVYPAPESKTEIKVTVNGPGVENYIQTETFLTTNLSPGETFKGYPSGSGIEDGVVTYDLSNLNFHVGETYSYTIEFIDWNDSIIENVTGDFSFPTANIVYSSVEVSDDFYPTFTWSVSSSSDYSEWIDKYNFYLDGAIVGTTTDLSFTLDDQLNPSQVYEWYVIPINKNNNAFFASPIPQAFSTTNHDSLSVTITTPDNNAILITGETYTISGSAVFSDGAIEKSSTWSLGSASGMEIDFTPSERFSNNSLSVSLTVTDSFNLSKTSASVNLTVLDPHIALKDDSQIIKKGVSASFNIDTSNTYDVISYEWFVDGESVGTSNSLNYSFDEAGDYTVYVKGTTISDMNGSQKTVQSNSVTVTVMGEAPIVTITSPASGSEIMKGSSVAIVAEITNENELKSTQWKENGEIISGETRSTFTFNPSDSGEYTLTVNVVDEHDQESQASIRVLVNNSLVEITNIIQGKNYSLNSSITPVVNAPNASSYTLFIDGNEVSGSTVNLTEYGTGDHTIYAIAYWKTIDEASLESNSISFTIVDLTPPEVSIDFPTDDMVWKTGETYTLAGSIDSDSAISDSWWEIDGGKLSNNSFTPVAGSKKLITVSYHAENTDVIEGSASIAVRVVDPSVYVSEPSDKTVLIGSTILVNASAIDADLFWLVDGEEVDAWDKIFQNTGAHTLQAGWRVEAINTSGSIEEFTGLSDEMIFTVYTDVPPVIVNSVPSNQYIKNTVGADLRFEVTASSGNILQVPLWKVFLDGTFENEQSGQFAVKKFTEPGLYTIVVEVHDDYGISVSREWTVEIFNPSIAITSPVEGTTFQLSAVPVPTVDTNKLTSYYFKIDGERKETSDFTNLPVGSYQLTAVGTYFVTGNSDPVEVSSELINFNVADLTPPDFVLLNIIDGDRIIAGETYTFSADPNGLETFEWILNGTVESTENELIYTPEEGEGIISFVLRGKLNGITVEIPFSVEVIEPSCTINLPYTSITTNGKNVYPNNTLIVLKAEVKDLDEIVWKENGTTIAGTTITFTGSGEKTITAAANAKNVRLSAGGYGVYQLEEVEARVIIAESVTVIAIETDELIYVGDSLPVSVTTNGEDTHISSLAYSIDEVVYSRESAPVNKSIIVEGLKAGNHKITVTATDVFGNKSSMDTNVTVYNPLAIEILQPSNGIRVSPDSDILVSFKVTAGQYESCLWTINREEISNSNFTSGSLGKLASGTYEIAVKAYDKNGQLTTSVPVSIEVQSDFQLNILEPADGSEILIGNSIDFRVGVKKVAGSTINLADAASNISWYIDGNDTGETGLTYTYNGTEEGALPISAKYEDTSGMVRETAGKIITVRELEPPSITKPENGSTITYSLGEMISLKATGGELGARYTWLLGDVVVAVGKEPSFNPNGLSGDNVQLALQMSILGQTETVITTVSFKLNTPPELTLNASAVQFTGDALSWTAAASDVEDQNPNMQITYYLDGVEISTDNPRTLSDADIGMHTLMAETTDSNNVTVTKQVLITVESSNLNVEIQSPISGATFFEGYDIPLKAGVAENGTAVSGTYSWIIEYLDDPNQASEALSGNNISLTSAALGEMSLTAKFTDSNGRERGSEKVIVEVEKVPVKLGIYWPHGSVVNSGDALVPELLGIPEGSSGTVEWSLNGKSISDITALSAPEIGGDYILSVQYSEDNISFTRAEVSFTINEVPIIQITTPINSSQYVKGNPIIFSAQVADDQPYEGTIIWKFDGAELGAGNPFVLEDASIGDLEITGTCVDQYGAEKVSAPTLVKVYQPLSKVVPTVNGGSASYFVSENGDALNAKLEYTGGIIPGTVWTLKQGERFVVKPSKEVSFLSNELIDFIQGPAVLTAVVTDTGLADVTKQELFRKDFPLTFFTGDTIAELVTPTPEDTFYVGDEIPLALNVKGFANPKFKVGVNSEEPSEVVFTLPEGLYTSTIAGTNFASEGIYELLIKVLEGDTEKEDVPFTLNVYTKRSGIFVDDAPVEINLDNGPVIVTAVTAGLEEADFDTIQWRTDIAVEPVGTGNTLNLAEAGLVPGDRTISVEALLDDNIIAQNSFIVKVFGPMTISVTPEEELIIIQKGAQKTLTALIRDRDGAEVLAENIVWSSHLNGSLGTGTTLALENFPDLAIGEHIISVEATGAYDESISILKKVQVNPVFQEVVPGSEPDSDTPDQETPEQLPPTTFRGGEEVVVIEEEPETLPDWWPAWL